MSIRYAVIDDCPVPRVLARRVRTLKRDVPGAVLISAYRGERAKRLLHRLGKHTQQELYDRWVANPGDYPAANQPGYSSHELRADGTAFYRRPRGARIPAWQCGMDWDDQHIAALQAAAAKRGWVLMRPYQSVGEHHHLNFKERPR